MKEWVGGKGVGRGGRSGPGGKEWAEGGEGVGQGERSGPGGKESAGGKGVGRGGKESAGADWVVVRYVSLLPRFFIRFLKRFQETEPFHFRSSLIIDYSETFWQFIPGD